MTDKKLTTTAGVVLWARGVFGLPVRTPQDEPYITAARIARALRLLESAEHEAANFPGGDGAILAHWLKRAALDEPEEGK